MLGAWVRAHLFRLLIIKTTHQILNPYSFSGTNIYTHVNMHVLSHTYVTKQDEPAQKDVPVKVDFANYLDDIKINVCAFFCPALYFRGVSLKLAHFLDSPVRTFAAHGVGRKTYNV